METENGVTGKPSWTKRGKSSHGPPYEVWAQKKELPFILIVPQLPMYGMDSLADYIRNRTPDQIPQRLETGVPPRPGKFPTPEIMSGDPQDTSFNVGVEGLPVGWPMVEDDLLWMIDHVLTNYKADASRLYLSGLSYGGFGSWYMASKHPDLFAAVALCSGMGASWPHGTHRQKIKFPYGPLPEEETRW